MSALRDSCTEGGGSGHVCKAAPSGDFAATKELLLETLYPGKSHLSFCQGKIR